MIAFGLLVCFAAGTFAASVAPGNGYANDFSVRPAASDWSTRGLGTIAVSSASEITTVAALDAAVQTNSASLITNQCGSGNGSPPGASIAALWSTNGYLQTRPSQNAGVLLMGTFRNDTVTNAANVRISYDYITNRAASGAEEVRGLRAYYSVTGETNSWVNIPQLSQTPQGTLVVEVALPQSWRAGSRFYLLWADDNGSGASDDANNIDNFSITIAGGLPEPALAPPSILQATPAPGEVFTFDSVAISFTEAVTGVDAGDLFVNGVPATAVSSADTATYVFSFSEPGFGPVIVSWAGYHAIQDFDSPPRAFDGAAAGSLLQYTLVNSNAPTVMARTPAHGATLGRLQSIRVSFNEAVTGVNAADLLINGAPASGATGSGADYTFTFTQPAYGAVSITWASDAAIHDEGGNAFDGSRAVNKWSYTLVDPTPPPLTHVVQISLDGLGATYLQSYLQTAPDQFPTFVRLTREAAFTMNARCDYDISETVPNHATIFTGRPVFQPAGESNTVYHGYNNNFPMAAETLHNSGNTNVPYKASMFDVAHDYGRTTAFYAGKARLSICERSYNETNGAPDMVAVGGDNGRDKIDFASVLDIQGAAISNEVNTLLADLTNATPKHYSFIHIAEPDLTGHAMNWGSAGWSNAVRMVDAQLARIIDAIDANPRLTNQTALIVTADHGGGGVMRNGHTEAYHVTNYTVPFFLRAPRIPGGVDLYTLFSNRGDPGTNRTDYTTQPQPIRNGDSSNLALALVGLPPIPGSFMVPVLATRGAPLHIARLNNTMTVFWSDPDDEYELQTATEIRSTDWQTITEGISVNNTTRTYTIGGPTGVPIRFFRLLKR